MASILERALSYLPGRARARSRSPRRARSRSPRRDPLATVYQPEMASVLAGKDRYNARERTRERSASSGNG
jgi:hypothetical protein